VGLLKRKRKSSILKILSRRSEDTRGARATRAVEAKSAALGSRLDSGSGPPTRRGINLCKLPSFPPKKSSKKMHPFQEGGKVEPTTTAVPARTCHDKAARHYGGARRASTSNTQAWPARRPPSWKKLAPFVAQVFFQIFFPALDWLPRLLFLAHELVWTCPVFFTSARLTAVFHRANSNSAAAAFVVATLYQINNNNIVNKVSLDPLDRRAARYHQQQHRTEELRARLLEPKPPWRQRPARFSAPEAWGARGRGAWGSRTW
jgi:hypothetical protein